MIQQNPITLLFKNYFTTLLLYYFTKNKNNGKFYKRKIESLEAG